MAQWRLRHIRLQLRVAQLSQPEGKAETPPQRRPNRGYRCRRGRHVSREERAVKTRLAICLAFAAISPAVLPVSASAQALLPPYEITTSVRSMGLEPISPPVRRGDRYVLRAIDGRGAEVTVVADALSGRILLVRPPRLWRRRGLCGTVYPPGLSGRIPSRRAAGSNGSEATSNGEATSSRQLRTAGKLRAAAAPQSGRAIRDLCAARQRQCAASACPGAICREATRAQSCRETGGQTGRGCGIHRLQSNSPTRTSRRAPRLRSRRRKIRALAIPPVQNLE